MQRIRMTERPNWRSQAEEFGFTFHTMYGEPYWDETAAYEFSLSQIEDDIEDPTAELHQMCLDLVECAVSDEALLKRLAIPEVHWNLVRLSWRAGEPSLYGRFDLVYDGAGPAKLLEYNADTPTSLYESAFYQWIWLKENIDRGALPRGADQFNSIQDKLIERMAALFEPASNVHFAACTGSTEDRQTVLYLEDCAKQAGLNPRFVALEQIGVDRLGRFADQDGYVIDDLFKLYPWENMLRDDFARYIHKSGARFLEPTWKAVLSNKGILPLLWEMFPGHPNLLPAYFADDPRAREIGQDYVRKPFFSREGANIEVFRNGSSELLTEGAYGAEGYVVQALCPPPVFDGNHTVIGSWIIGNEPAGIGIREDSTMVTRDLSRFVPHVIL